MLLFQILLFLCRIRLFVGEADGNQRSRASGGTISGARCLDNCSSDFPVSQEALMILAWLNILVALFLGYGAVEEFWVRGVRGGEVQPLVVGLVGACVSALLALSGVRLWRRHARARAYGRRGAAFDCVSCVRGVPAAPERGHPRAAGRGGLWLAPAGRHVHAGPRSGADGISARVSRRLAGEVQRAHIEAWTRQVEVHASCGCAGDG